eukprot:TRINITY_DN23292_c0_g1_i2.p1 TRINITY_DN23292_c0_g1~~TRINITY_DN23292_c0_g1_i2.p1  ORF type:complete len:185 (+),score=23.39 TRINITY_DN23292_c0_g1_i2:267-821(+)
MQAYLGSLEVQLALKAVPADAKVASKWQMWDGDTPHYNITVADARDHFRRLLEEGLQVLAYNGVVDTALPYIGAAMWTHQLGGGEVLEPRRIWAVEDSEKDGELSGKRVAGHVVRYKNGLTFATVSGAGHLVAGDRPAAARSLIRSFVQGHELPRYAGEKCTPLWVGRKWVQFCDEEEPSSLVV